LTEAQHLIDESEKNQADFIEVRLDLFKHLDEITSLAAHGKKPKIATNKPLSCGGMFSGTEVKRRNALLDAAKCGFEYVDTELSTDDLEEFSRQIRKTGAKTVVSSHDFSGTPDLSKLKEILRKEIAAGADVCKVITTAKTVGDNLTVLNFISSVAPKTRIVSFAMGELGRTSRLLSPFFGGLFTFASLKQGSETATGQMSIKEMRTAYRILGLA
jgi:3-dehydroquinate dehydratase type I